MSKMVTGKTSLRFVIFVKVEVLSQCAKSTVIWRCLSLQIAGLSN